jgi:hypothetical protein
MRSINFGLAIPIIGNLLALPKWHHARGHDFQQEAAAQVGLPLLATQQLAIIA